MIFTKTELIISRCWEIMFGNGFHCCAVCVWLCWRVDDGGSLLLFGFASFSFWLQHCVLCFFPFAVAVMCALILCLQWDGWEKFFAFSNILPRLEEGESLVGFLCVLKRVDVCVCVVCLYKRCLNTSGNLLLGKESSSLKNLFSLLLR